MNVELLKWTLIGEGLLLLFLSIQLILFFYRHRDLEVTLSFLSLLALLALQRFYELDESFKAVWVKDSFLLALFFTIALWPFLAFFLKRIFRPARIRRFLARNGPLDELLISLEVLQQEHVGALIAIERRNPLKSTIQKGVMIDSRVKRQLLVSLFAPNTPTHDGGVILSGDRIAACAAIFPLSQRQVGSLKLGTRHRAALGLSEQTDALVVVVSEETGTLSVCYRGRLSRGLDEDRLRRFLAALLLRGRAADSAWRRAQEQLDITPEGIAKSEQMAGEEKNRV